MQLFFPLPERSSPKEVFYWKDVPVPLWPNLWPASAFCSLKSRGACRKIKIGICVPGIADNRKDTVWAPISRMEQFSIEKIHYRGFTGAEAVIASDRTCYILGETSMGVARGFADAIYIGIGTGIGARIMSDGRVIHGSADIPGQPDGWRCSLRS